MQQKLAKIFLQPEAEAFGNNIGKKTTKATPKTENSLYYIFTEDICSAI